MILRIPHRPARLLSVVAAFLCLSIWLTLQDGCWGCDNRTVVIRRPGDNHKQRGTSRVAKVTVAANRLNNDVIHRALLSHQAQNQIHGYKHYVAMNEAVSDLIENDSKHRAKGAWTKPAYLLSIIVGELEKPEEDRLEWVFWFDADTVVMNPETPLEVFLPPKVEKTSPLATINLLMASNWDGLNSGAFALRVDPWSASLLSAVLAYPIYKSAKLQNDRFRDQSAFQYLLTASDSPLASTVMKGKEYWAEVPMRWFNSLPVNNAFYASGEWLFGKEMTDELFDKGTEEILDDGKGGKIQPWKIMQGDMIVHFAGSSNVRDSWMAPWLNRSEACLPEWSNATKQVEFREQAAAFWEGVSIEKSKEMIEARARKAKEDKEKEERAKQEKEKEEKAKQEKEKEEKAKEHKAKEEKAKEEKAKAEQTSKEPQDAPKADGDAASPSNKATGSIQTASAGTQQGSAPESGADGSDASNSKLVSEQSFAAPEVRIKIDGGDAVFVRGSTPQSHDGSSSND